MEVQPPILSRHQHAAPDHQRRKAKHKGEAAVCLRPGPAYGFEVVGRQHGDDEGEPVQPRRRQQPMAKGALGADFGGEKDEIKPC